MFDPITGSLTDKEFDYLLQLEVKRAARYSYPFSLLVIEVDQENHEEHEVLRTMSALIQEQIRGTDVVGKSRIGGHEKLFRILLSHTEPNVLQFVGERIRIRTGLQAFRFDDREEHRTVSEGGACFPSHSTDPSELTRIAEKMLQKARKEGGNNLCLPS